MMLTAKQARFCIEYCVDFNATQAAIRAGYSEDSAGAIGHENLQKLEIIERIEQRKEELAAAAALTPEWVLNQWLKLAGGDPSDLSRVKIVNCRHCWGYDGAYQYTQNEYKNTVDEAIERGKPAPECLGGMDFDPNAPPNGDCQECGGDGVEIVCNVDTLKVKGRSRGLFAGIKQTANGPEIKLRDQDAALKNIAAYLGMSIDRKELSGPGGRPIATVAIGAKELTDAQLEATISGSDVNEA